MPDIDDWLTNYPKDQAFYQTLRVVLLKCSNADIERPACIYNAYSARDDKPSVFRSSGAWQVADSPRLSRNSYFQFGHCYCRAVSKNVHEGNVFHQDTARQL